ncbi:hypothetical protein, partial [Pseudaminobacter soli (ex Li et al. 2025)]|uniref:hypothetical protein n=1 Tax=Pseudaminobacter soli (ex Li et al. 2025) TaxID=1295366 RepID=UPI001AECB98C
SFSRKGCKNAESSVSQSVICTPNKESTNHLKPDLPESAKVVLGGVDKFKPVSCGGEMHHAEEAIG